MKFIVHIEPRYLGSVMELSITYWFCNNLFLLIIIKVIIYIFFVNRIYDYDMLQERKNEEIHIKTSWKLKIKKLINWDN